MKFKINPVYQKELKGSARSIKTAILIFGFNLVLVLIGLLSFYFLFGYSNNVEYMGILQIYICITVIEFGLVLFVVPAYTASAISSEREKQTLDILLTTRLSSWQIIQGKLFASISTILLLIVSSLPVLAIVFSVGGVHMLDLVQFMFFCLTTAVFVGSVGLFYSTLFKKTVSSTVFTYGSIILLIVGTAAVVFVLYKMKVQEYDKIFYASDMMEMYNPPDTGNLVLLLLLNPAVTLLSLLSRQFGSVDFLSDFLGTIGRTSPVIFQHWYVISTIIQLSIAFLLLCLSARRLNPLNKKK